MNLRASSILGLFLALASTAPAADPGWWAARGVKNSSPASNRSPATVGQAKHMAAMALVELEQRLPAPELLALKDAVAAVVDLDVPGLPSGYNPAPPPPGYIGPNRHVLLGGQLKALAKPFYDHLRLWNAVWLDNEMIEANIRVMEPGSSPASFSPYPWSVATSDDANKAMASLGQLKSVFSLRLEMVPAYDTDGDGMPDAWEMQHGLEPAADDSGGDPDLDGLTNLQEFLASTNPADPDSDGDLLPDGWENTYGFDPLTNDQDALTADPDGDGFSNFRESVYGTDPYDASSVPPGTPDVEIIDPPLPPDDPPPPPPPPATSGADWHFEMVTARKYLPKYGVAEFIDSTPPRRYLLKAETVSFKFTGDDGEVPESPINGARLTMVDPLTGGQMIEDHQHEGSNGERNDNMGGSVEPQSATVALEVTEVHSYDDEPNARADRDATKTLKIVLDEENTNEMLIENVIAELPPYPAEYSDGNPQAFRNLLEDELGIDYQKVSYRIVWNDGVAPEDRHAVSHLVVFEPEDDPDSEGNESEEDVEVVKVIEWDGLDEESPNSYEIDPETERPGKDGRYFLLPVKVAVDADRDGVITFDGKDKTTFQKPYRFWVNDDRDIEDHNETDGGYLEEDDVDSFASDCDQPGLEYRRDLEDLTRLWIDFSGISQVFPASDPAVALKVRIESESGDPRITFFQPVESDGGRQYLKDETTGSSQLQGSYGQELCRVSGASSVEIPRRAWETLPSDKVVHLLFEGAKEGDAELVFEIWKDGEKVCDLPTVYIVLKKAEDMYETWSVGDVVDEGVDYTKWPASTFSQTTGQDLPSPEKPEEKDYIMFVHGWNMPPWEKETFGSTMFKRMWHQGYKGRFGMFRWPTFHGFEGDFEDLTQDPDHFNASEIRAWNSASRLKALIENRASVFGSDKIRLYGHSMGNIVCGEALRQFGSSGAPVHSYIAAQAAISSHVYDKTTPARKPAYQLEMPNVYGYYWQHGASDWPPQWEIDGRPSYMHPQYLPGNVTYINHYNFDDYALNGTRWPLNQDLKPGFNYHYTFQGLVGGYSDYRFIRGPRYDQTILNVPADRYEIFSNAADSVANSLGKVGSTGGKFSESVNVAPLLVYDGNAKAHKYHSGQFRSTIQKRWEYWRIALDNMDIRTPAQ